MNCPHCGAPVIADICEYCGCRVREPIIIPAPTIKYTPPPMTNELLQRMANAHKLYSEGGIGLSTLKQELNAVRYESYAAEFARLQTNVAFQTQSAIICGSGKIVQRQTEKPQRGLFGRRKDKNKTWTV